MGPTFIIKITKWFFLENKAQTYIHGLDENQLEKLNFINLDKYPICRAAVEPRAETALLYLAGY